MGSEIVIDHDIIAGSVQGEQGGGGGGGRGMGVDAGCMICQG